MSSAKCRLAWAQAVCASGGGSSTSLACLENLLEGFSEREPLASSLDEPMADFFSGSDEDLVRLATAAEDVQSCWEQPGLDLPLLCGRALQPFLEACLRAEREHPGCELRLVYHWTQSDNLPSIARTGLMVADGTVVPVVHGRRHGKGVYTSPTFNFGRDRYGNVALLCIGLRGAMEDQSGSWSASSSPEGDSLSVSRLSSLEVDDMLVYRTASQVLPCAVVAASQLGRAEDTAFVTMAMLYHNFPKLRLTPGELQARAAEAEAKAIIAQWDSGRLFLVNPVARLRREKAWAEGMDGFYPINEIPDDVTVKNRLAEWEVTLRLPTTAAHVVQDGRMCLRLLFPPGFPLDAPHLIVTRPRIRSCTEASQLVIADGGINVDSLLKSRSRVEGWQPAFHICDVFQALRSVIAEGALTLDAGTYNRQEILLAMRAHKPGAHAHVKNRMDQLATVERRPAGNLSDRTCFPTFVEVLAASQQFRAELGGAPGFPGGQVSLAGKLTRIELQAHTAFEHMQLTVLGLAKLEQILPEVQQLNNGKYYMDNPGTQLLERECGFTMHADRPGSAAVLQDASVLLLRTFEVAKNAGQVSGFFFRAFDRHSDPCLEGRVSLLVDFLQDQLAAM